MELKNRYKIITEEFTLEFESMLNEMYFYKLLKTGRLFNKVEIFEDCNGNTYIIPIRKISAIIKLR